MCFTDKDNINVKEYSLEEHLEIKCKNNEKYKHLYAAWTTDKDVYTNSLSSVPVNFPHYSKHEASHSLSIINKIEMLLGVERIKSLSPTDTFLILESAFSHDLGMIIPTEILREEWKKPSFKRFLKRLATDGFDEDITKAVKYLLEIQDKDIEFNDKNRDWPVEVRDAVILITAEYFRKGHGSRSELWLKQSEKIAASINGNKFIPERIMNIVGKVATAHGREFEDVLTNLEHIQNGIGVDKIHPRFIACLIRLGDLLDLDNGRFNEVFEKTSPSPESSKVHKEKHRSITHFLVSPERIEVSAICKDDNVYRETRAWFDWLSDELKNLSSKWSDIVPRELQGGPPSLGDIKLSIKGAEDITEQLNLRFNIDPVRAFELIEGNGIYNDELVFIRELLQNAMDATKVKVWRDIQNKHYDDIGALIGNEFKEKKLSEYDFSFPRELPQNLKEFYPIKINVEYENIKDDTEDGSYIFTIEDRGCGISLKDLKRMENVGGSWEQDNELQDFIEKMPGWLQPTGSFGIGLHSVFVIADEMKIETKSDNEIGYSISFVSRRKNGYITVKKESNIFNTGTKIELKINKTKIEKIMKDNYNSYDYFDPDSKKKRIKLLLKNNIREVTKNISMLNISSNLINEKDVKIEGLVKNIQAFGPYGKCGELKYYIYLNEYEEKIEGKFVTTKKWSMEIYDYNYEAVVNLKINDRKIESYSQSRGGIKTRFKEISCNNTLEIPNQELFNIDIEFKKGKAKEILDVSRQSLKTDICSEYSKRIEKVIIPEALNYLNEEFKVRINENSQYIYNEIDNKFINSAQLLKLRLAFNYFLDKEEEYMKEWGNNISIGHEAYYVCDDNSTYTFGDLLESKYIIRFEDNSVTDNIKHKINEFMEYVEGDKVICMKRFFSIFNKYAYNNFLEIKKIRNDNDLKRFDNITIEKRKQQVKIYNDRFVVNCLKTINEVNERLKLLSNKENRGRQILFFVGYDDDKNKVQLLYKNIICVNSTGRFHYRYRVKNNLCIFSPFKENCDELIKALKYNLPKILGILKKEHNFDELVDWVSKNAVYKTESEDFKMDVIRTYMKFIEDYIEVLKTEDEEVHIKEACLQHEENNKELMDDTTIKNGEDELYQEFNETALDKDK